MYNTTGSHQHNEQVKQSIKKKYKPLKTDKI